MTSYYAMQVVSEHINGTLRLNDVVIGQWNGNSPPSRMELINLWITGETNQVSMTFDWPSERETGSSHLDIIIFSTTRSDQSVSQGTRIAEFHWPENSGVNKRPLSANFQFTAESPPSQLWSSAASITLDATTRHEAFTLLAQLQHALVSRNSGQAAALLDWKTADVARSMYMDVAASRDSLNEFLDFFFSDPSFTMLPLDEKQLEFRLAANGRLLWVSRSHGAGVLRSVTSPRLELPVYLARVNEQWRIAR